MTSSSGKTARDLRRLISPSLEDIRVELLINDNDDDKNLVNIIEAGTRKVLSRFARRASYDTIASRDDLLDALKDAVYLYTCFRWKLRKKSLDKMTMLYQKDYDDTMLSIDKLVQATPGPRAKRRSGRTHHDEEIPRIFSQSYGLGQYLP